MEYTAPFFLSLIVKKSSDKMAVKLAVQFVAMQRVNTPQSETQSET